METEEKANDEDERRDEDALFDEAYFGGVGRRQGGGAAEEF
jgi:hypothetical protein